MPETQTQSSTQTQPITAAELEPHVERLRRRIGMTMGPHIQTVEAGAIARFARAIGETNPLYFDAEYARTTRFGGIIAPPTYVSCFITDLTAEMYDLDLPLPRALHTDDITENDHPIRPGDTISTTALYADAYIKQGRNGPMVFQAVDLTSVNQKGERVAVIRMMACSFS